MGKKENVPEGWKQIKSSLRMEIKLSSFLKDRGKSYWRMENKCSLFLKDGKKNNWRVENLPKGWKLSFHSSQRMENLHEKVEIKFSILLKDRKKGKSFLMMEIFPNDGEENLYEWWKLNFHSSWRMERKSSWRMERNLP
jgi:hypothetical protein